MTRARNSYRRSSYWLAGLPAKVVVPDGDPEGGGVASVDEVRVPQPGDLRFGYTLADLERIARSAAATTRAMAGDYDDRYQEAFGAAAEYLYAAEQPPAESDLFRAAQDALFDQSRHDRSYRGTAYRHGEGWGANGSGPNFVRYWYDLNLPTPSPENRVVDRLALEQILPTLSPGQREAVNALAVGGDYETAVALLGANRQTFRNQIGHARRRFLAWWHEGEEPSRPWGTDRPTGARGAMGVIRRRAKYAERTERQPAVPAAPIRTPTGRALKCSAGHPWDETNTRVRSNGARACRACEAGRKRDKKYAQVRAAIGGESE